jgi:23S rRNA (uridine2552-2'-O)-methyltransferase
MPPPSKPSSPQKESSKAASNKPASSKKPSPQNPWTQRQARDPFVLKAKKEGYIARSAYKLVEMDDRYHLLKPGQRLLDLGAAPGGWCQVVLQRVRPQDTGGLLIALDLLEMAEFPGVRTLQGDIGDPAMVRQILDILNGGRVDGILSDMAPNTSGHPDLDHLKIMALVEEALELAHDCLAAGGFFLVKIFQGSDAMPFKVELQKRFRQVDFVKPEASRRESREIYLLARDFTAPRLTSP